MQEIILLTTIPEKQFGFSEEVRRGRAAEFEQCLANNCKTDINRVIVFFEGREEAVSKYPSLAHEKVQVILIRERPKLSLFFDYANEHLAGNFVIVSNADIYFDPNTPVNRIREIQPGCLWALSRYKQPSEAAGADAEVPQGGWSGSYDSYIFHAPLKKFKAGFLIGVTGSDSYLVQKAVEASVRVSNPCLSLITRHVDHFWLPHHRPGKKPFNQANAYWNMPDYRGYPGFPYWPVPSRIEDEDYITKHRLMYIAAAVVSRVFGKKRAPFIVNLMRAAWTYRRRRIQPFFHRR